MPLYEFKCKKCGGINEFLANLGEEAESFVCKNCKSADLEKVLSVANVSKYPSAKNGKTCYGSGEGCGQQKRCCES